MSSTTTRPSTATGSGRRVAVTLGVAAVAAAFVWAAFFLGDDADPGQGAVVEEFSHVHGLAIPPWADGDVLVSTHQGAFRIGADNDWEWISEEPHDFMGFAAHPQDDETLYSSGHPAPGSDLPNPIGFMVSTDGGASWEPRSLQGEADFHAMAVHPEDGEVVYAYDGRQGLLRSDDGGQSWEQLPAQELQEAGGVVSIAGGPGGTDDVLAGTQTGLLASDDGGRSWEPLRSGGMVTAVAVDADRILAYVAEEDGLVESTDGGESWSSAGLSLDPDAAGHVAVDPHDPDRMWVGTFEQALWRTTNAGEQWEKVAENGTPTGR